MAKSGKSGSAGSGGKGKQSPAKKLLGIMQKLTKREGDRIELADLREQMGLSRAAFDKALVSLYKDRVISMSRTEGRHGAVPKRIVDAGIDLPIGGGETRMFDRAYLRDD